MTATLAPPAAAPENPPPARRRHSRRWLRVAIPFAVVFALVAMTVTAHVVQQPDPSDPGFLSPTSTAGIGGKALADRIAGRQIPLEVQTSTPGATASARATPATIFIPAPEFVNPAYAQEASELPQASRIVLVAPSEQELADLDVQARVNGPRWTATAPPPGCADSAGPAAVRRLWFTDVVGAVQRCYADGLVTVAGGDGPPIVLVGASDAFRNDRAGEHDNGAFAAQLLSAGPQRVIWLDLHREEQPPPIIGTAGPTATPVTEYPSPTPAATRGGSPPPADSGDDPPPPRPAGQSLADSALAKAFPPSVWAAVLLLALALLALAAARARRLGAPVPEPLPVRVRAAETVQGHAGLYRRAKARDASLATLQATAVRRLAEHFGVRPDFEDVARRTAEAINLPVHNVRAVLGGGLQDSDIDLAHAGLVVQNLVQQVTGRPPDLDSNEENPT